MTFEKQNRNLAEVGSLASAQSYRNSDQNVPMHGNKIMYTYASQYLGVDDLVIAVNPKHRHFYEHILLFEQIGEERRYEFVKGAPAVAMRLDLITMKKRYMAVYGNKEMDRDMHHFVFNKECESIKLPPTHEPVRLDKACLIEIIGPLSR